jgi:hypothetical protein
VKVIRIATFFAAGYVLGSKAGHERYEQIVAAARTVSQRLENYSNSSSSSVKRRTSAIDSSDSDS